MEHVGHALLRGILCDAARRSRKILGHAAQGSCSVMPHVGHVLYYCMQHVVDARYTNDEAGPHHVVPVMSCGTWITWCSVMVCSTWIMLNTQTRRPARIPDAMLNKLATFSPDTPQ